MFEGVQLVFLVVDLVLPRQTFSKWFDASMGCNLLLFQGELQRTDAFELEHLIQSSGKAASQRPVVLLSARDIDYAVRVIRLGALASVGFPFTSGARHGIVYGGVCEGGVGLSGICGS